MQQGFCLNASNFTPYDAGVYFLISLTLTSSIDVENYNFSVDSPPNGEFVFRKGALRTYLVFFRMCVNLFPESSRVVLKLFCRRGENSEKPFSVDNRRRRSLNKSFTTQPHREARDSTVKFQFFKDASSSSTKP
jgi:hypothetical protein